MLVFLLFVILLPLLCFYSILVTVFTIYHFPIFAIPILIVAYIHYVIARKLDARNPWLAFVPFLDTLLLFDMTGKPYFWFVGYFIPFVNIAMIIMLWMEVASDLGFSPWVGILMFIPGVSLPALIFMAVSGKPMRPDKYYEDPRRRRYA